MKAWLYETLDPDRLQSISRKTVTCHPSLQGRETREAREAREPRQARQARQAQGISFQTLIEYCGAGKGREGEQLDVILFSSSLLNVHKLFRSQLLPENEEEVDVR